MKNNSIESIGNLLLCCTRNTLMIKEENEIIKKVVSSDLEFLEEERLEFMESLNRHKQEMDKLESFIYVNNLV